MIPTNTASGRRFALVSLLAWVLVAGAGCSDNGNSEGDTGPAQNADGGPVCPFDEIGEPGKAASMEVGSTQNGHICPKQDQDWYEFSLSKQRQIVDVSLSYATQLTSVQPAYRIWSTSGGEKDENVGSSPAEKDTQIAGQHCLGEGTYKVEVYDRQNDDEDRRRPYSLKLETTDNPDQHEPNDGRDEAVAMQGGGSKEGYIACKGDEDWYSIEIPDGNVLKFELNSDEVDYQPQVQVLGPSGDDTVYASAANNQAGGKKTQISRFAVVPEGGKYFVKVADNPDEPEEGEKDEADAKVPYTLKLTLQSDTDQHEPNDDSEKATDITDGGAASCGSGWGQTFEALGTIGGEKDQDWYRVPLDGCGDGIVDAEVELAGGGDVELNKEIQLRLRMVRPHEQTDCSSNNDCDVINAECDRSLDCRGLGAACDKQRAYCTGGIKQCMPSGKCGVIQVQREFPCTKNKAQYRDGCGEGKHANRADIGAPLPETDAVYFQVTDVGFDGAAPEAPYTLRVRVQNETDSNEPNNFYIGNDALFDNHAENLNHERGKEIPVYDCTNQTMSSHGDAGGDAHDGGTSDGGASDSGGSMDTAMSQDTAMSEDTAMSQDTSMSQDTGGGGGDDLLPTGCCAGSAEWTTGAISYDNDVDHFKYKHPCPEGDCVMNFHYRLESGPVDHFMNVLSSGPREWYTLAAQCEQGNQSSVGPTVSGAQLTSGQPNVCFYAFQGHGSKDDRHTYGLKIEDNTGEFEDNAFVPSTRDWDPSQQYSFCIEKVADGCPGPPCNKADNGECNGGGEPNRHGCN